MLIIRKRVQFYIILMLNCKIIHIKQTGIGTYLLDQVKLGKTSPDWSLTDR